MNLEKILGLDKVYCISLKKNQAASAQTPRYNPPKSIQKSDLLVLAKFTREFSLALKS